MNTYDMDERISTVAVTLGRIGTGDLVPLCIKILMHIDKGEGMEMLNDITQCDLLEYNDKIALITIIRVASFDFEMTYGWNICIPSEMQVIAQFWDEAVGVLNGDATLVIDICNETSRDYYSGNHCYDFPPRRRSDGTPIRPWRRTERDPYTGEAYEHRMLNCTTNVVYKEHRPYVLWWEPTLKPSYRY